MIKTNYSHKKYVIEVQRSCLLRREPKVFRYWIMMSSRQTLK